MSIRNENHNYNETGPNAKEHPFCYEKQNNFGKIFLTASAHF